ncbi:MAG: InlB B-repeat-containing protein, partial [Lachnospiraceae bacterium]|nr:InlB B-repeat-containing protein [Lachnospiraceae bacterium]
GLNSNFKTSKFAAIESKSPNAVWIAKNNKDEVAIMEEPINKGMITFINDINYMNNNPAQAKIFLANALNTSIESIEKAKIRNITFDAQKGQGGTENFVSKQGEELSDITVPNRVGYTFDGYYTKLNGEGDKYYDSVGKATRVNDFDDDVTLYANWNIIPATSANVSVPDDVTGLVYGSIDGAVKVTAKPASDSEYTLTYQWYSSKTDSNMNGTAIEGATKDTYTLPKDLEAGEHHYYCVVTATRNDNNESATVASKVSTVTVDKKAVTVSAVDQTIEVGSQISTDADMATLTGALDGSFIKTITLTPSDTTKPTRKGNIIPGNAVIVDANGKDVTANYDITYIDSNLTVKGEKNITVSIETEEEEVTITVPNFNSDMAVSLLDDEELADYDTGISVNEYLQIKYISESDVAEDEIATLNELVLENGMEIEKYIDITLWKKIGDNEPVQITETNGKKFSIKLDITDDENNYSIVRIHNGKAEILAESDSDEILFETDCFSTYVLVYTTPEPEIEEVPVENVKENNTEPNNKNNTLKKENKVAKIEIPKSVVTAEAVSPKTGYTDSIVMYYILLVLSLITSVSVYELKLKREE